jgi:hypothetical protein
MLRHFSPSLQKMLAKSNENVRGISQKGQKQEMLNAIN